MRQRVPTIAVHDDAHNVPEQRLDSKLTTSKGPLPTISAWRRSAWYNGVVVEW